MPQPNEHREIELPAGTIRYRDSGEGRPVVFVHGFLVDGRLWDGVAESLAARGGYRCIQPDWPLGSHRIALKPDADLSPYGLAQLFADFFEALDLRDVIVAGNDSGGALSQVFVSRHPERVGALALTNCDAFEEFPPGPFKPLPSLVKVPGAMELLALPLRVPAVAKAAYKPFTKQPLPADLVASWVEPALRDAGVKRDTRKFLAGMNKRYTLEAAERLRSFDKPSVIAWAPEDRTFKLKEGRKLAETIPGAKFVEVPNAATFVPFDQPQAVAEAIAGLDGAGASS